MPAEQHTHPLTDIEIARQAKMRHIQEIADKLDISDEYVYPYSKHRAKIDREYLESLDDKPNGKLILVAGITPTPAGEGKTTTSV